MRAPVRTALVALFAVALLAVTFVVVSGGGPPALDETGRAPTRGEATASDAGDVDRLAGEVSALDGDTARERSVAGDPDATAQTAAGRAGAAQLVGAAVDTAGAPIAGARLMATTRRSSIPLGLDASPLDAAEGLPARPGADEVARASADEAGALSVPLPPAAPELRAGRDLELLLRARGFVPARPPGERMGAVLPHDVGAIALRPGLTVQGTVRGPGGRTIEGASLAFGQADLTGLASEVAPTRGLPFAVTAEDGRFTCDELRPGRFWIIAAAPGLAPARAEGNLRPGDSIVGFDLTLQQAVSISGTCEGVPEGLVATVLAAATDGEGVDQMERRWRELPIDPATGAFGRSAFVDGVTYELRVALVDPVTGERDLTRAVRRAEVTAPASDVLLTWQPRTVVVGRVVTRDEAGAVLPLERFMVAFAEGDQKSIDFDARTLETGGEPKRLHAEGRFRFDDLAAPRRGRRRGQESGARPMTFRVRSVGFEDLFIRGVQIRAGETNDLGDLELVRGATLTVRVKGPGGMPVEGARVYACDAESDRWFERWRGRDEPAWTSDTVRYGETDGGGVAYLPLPPGEAVLRIAANADGYVFAAPIESPRSEDEVLLKLVRGATVVATLVTGSGSPAAGVPVQLVAQGEGLRGPRRLDARTDEAGQARFDSVQPGAHVLRSAPPRMRPRPPALWKEQEKRLEVPATGTVEATLTVRPVVEVTGRVIEAGAPVPGARVEFAVRDGEVLVRPDWRTEALRAVADADGRFVMTGVPVGPYDVGVAHPTRSMATRFDIEVTETPLPLVLALPDATLAGTAVYAGNDRPARNVSLRIEDLSGEARAFIGEQTLREEPDGDLERDSDWTDPGRTRTGRGGGFRFDGVATGEPLRIRISGEFVRSQTVEVPALSPGEVRDDVTVRISRAGSIEVRVERGNERRRDRLVVQVQRLDDDGLPAGRADTRRERGRQRYDGLTPGKYRVRVGATVDGGFREDAVQEVNVTPGRRARVRLRTE